jgi:uncharacterized protein
VGEAGPGPTRDDERIAALDVLRGVAILGILPANLPSFAYPMAVCEDVVHFVSPAPSEAVAHGAMMLLIHFKFISIFSFLFGAGLALQRSRDASSAFFPRTAWRLALLAGLGVLHAVLLWPGDVLLYYACIGALGLAALGLAPRWLLVLGGALLIVPIGLSLLAAPLLSVAPDLAGLGASPRTLDAALAAPDVAGIGREVMTFRSDDYVAMLRVRVGAWAMFLIAVIIFYSWRIAGLFALGMAAFKLGLLAPDDARRAWLRRLRLVGLVVGLPIEVAHAVAAARDVGTLSQKMLLHAAHEVGSLGLMAAYVSTVLLLSPATIARLRGLAAVGRLALTNYLGQTIICTTLFYGYGLGLYASVTRAQLWLVALAVWTLQVLLSLLWLRRYRASRAQAKTWRARPPLT